MRTNIYFNKYRPFVYRPISLRLADHFRGFVRAFLKFDYEQKLLLSKIIETPLRYKVIYETNFNFILNKRFIFRYFSPIIYLFFSSLQFRVNRVGEYIMMLLHASRRRVRGTKWGRGAREWGVIIIIIITKSASCRHCASPPTPGRHRWSYPARHTVLSSAVADVLLRRS